MIFADALAKKLPSKFIPKWKFDSDLIKLGKKCQKKSCSSMVSLFAAPVIIQLTIRAVCLPSKCFLKGTRHQSCTRDLSY